MSWAISSAGELAEAYCAGDAFLDERVQRGQYADGVA